jgi:hypothetical protein
MEDNRNFVYIPQQSYISKIFKFAPQVNNLIAIYYNEEVYRNNCSVNKSKSKFINNTNR